MTTTFTPSLRLWEGQPGDPAIRNAWGTALNQNQVLLESAILGTAIVNIAGLSTYTLITANGAADQARPYVQSYTGALTANCTVTLPNVPKIGWAQNSTTGGFNVVLTSGVGTTETIPPDGRWYWFQCDGAGDISLQSVGFGGIATPGQIAAASITTTGTVAVGGLLTGNDGITAGADLISSAETLTTAIFGQLIEITGASALTEVLPTPVNNPGGFRLWLHTTTTGVPITFQTPGGSFLGPYGNGTGTITVSQTIAHSYLFDSDGANWAVTAVPDINSGGTLTVQALSLASGLPPGVQFGDMKHSALGIEGAGWRLCYGQARPQTDPFWVFMVANGLTGSWLPGFSGSSTYNMPDARDLVLAGLDNMGGSDRGLLTSAGAGFDPTVLLNIGGNQQLQAHSHGASASDSGHNHADAGHTHTDAGHSHIYDSPQSTPYGYEGGGSFSGQVAAYTEAGYAAIQTSYAAIETGYANISVGIAEAGGGGSQNVQPTMITAVLMYVGA